MPNPSILLDNRDHNTVSNLRSLSATEMRLFQSLTVEGPDTPVLRLDHAAALLMAGRPLATHAGGLFGWALARSVARDIHSADEDLEWVVRTNPVDWNATAVAVRQLVEGVNDTSSEPIKYAAATVLRMLGDKDSSDDADGLQPVSRQEQRRRIQTFCDTNPHDPSAMEGTNLDNARNAAALIVPINIWNQLGLTIEDDTVEGITPALARFDPPCVVKLLRHLTATAPNRTGMQLRQLSWRLVEISPMFDQAALTAVRAAYDALVADPERIGTPDLNWVASCLVRSMTPHLLPEGQLAVNGKPVKGLWTARSTVFGFDPNATAGHATADVARGNVIDMYWEITQLDGTPIGTLSASGLTRGSPPPGAPRAQTGDNLSITGGTGAFLGARGQAGVIDLGSPRQASIVEDPASRRTIGGAKRSYVLHLLPLSTPEILVGQNGLAVVHGDGSLVTTAKPAQTGEILSLYASGLGPTLPGIDPGQPFTADPLQVVNSPVDVIVGGAAATVLYAGGFPGAMNAYQVNFRVPDGVQPGTASIQLSAAWIPGSPVKIAVR